MSNLIKEPYSALQEEHFELSYVKFHQKIKKVAADNVFNLVCSFGAITHTLPVDVETQILYNSLIQLLKRKMLS